LTIKKLRILSTNPQTARTPKGGSEGKAVELVGKSVCPARSFWFESPRGNDLETLRMEANLTPAELLGLFDISKRTWLRYLDKGCPRHIELSLSLLSGRLDHLGWPDWSMNQGRLFHSQLKHGFTPEYILAAWWKIHELSLLRGEKQKKTKLPGEVKKMIAKGIHLVNQVEEK